MPVKKMKGAKFFFLFLSLFLFLNARAYAQEKVVRLKDGTVMHGEILSKANGIYRINTKALGMVSVRSEDVMAVDEAAGAAPASSEKELYQQRILTNPATMSTIQDLARDEEIMEMFSDPALRDAILRQDVEYLKNDERFLKFTQNPAIQKIVQEVTQEGGDSVVK